MSAYFIRTHTHVYIYIYIYTYIWKGNREINIAPLDIKLLHQLCAQFWVASSTTLSEGPVGG